MTEERRDDELAEVLTGREGGSGVDKRDGGSEDRKGREDGEVKAAAC